MCRLKSWTAFRHCRALTPTGLCKQSGVTPYQPSRRDLKAFVVTALIFLPLAQLRIFDRAEAACRNCCRETFRTPTPPRRDDRFPQGPDQCEMAAIRPARRHVQQTEIP